MPGGTTRKCIPDHIFYTSSKKESSGGEGKRGKRKTEENVRGRVGCFPACHLLYSAQQYCSVDGATVLISAVRETEALGHEEIDSADLIPVGLHTNGENLGFPLQGNCWFYLISHLHSSNLPDYTPSNPPHSSKMCHKSQALT